MKGLSFQNELVRLALSMVGRHEEPLGSNTGPQIQEFFDADSYKPNKADNGYAWCASFVDRIVQLTMLSLGVPETATFKRPTTPGAWDLERWSMAQDRSTLTIKPVFSNTIKKGDIVILKVSHVLIAVSDVREDGTFESVEGNSNAAGGREGVEVVHKRGSKARHWSCVRSVIRFRL